MAMDEQSLGEQLCRHRKRLGVSQEYLAEILRLDQTYISKTETGKRQLTVDEFARWCVALNLDDKETLSILRSVGSS